MEIAVISGKGGTGKSGISAAFATLCKEVVLADCDVDAANLYLIFKPLNDEELVYTGGQKAVIDYDICSNCLLCAEYCRFDAITSINNKVAISDILCDGCRLCERICPEKAISMIFNDKSRMFSGSFRNGRMVYGRLAPGEENSGKLVSIVREKAKQQAGKYNIDLIILDGPPGIGCPVISTITGVDQLVIVTEATVSALHDLKRLFETVSSFNIRKWLIINKYDINTAISDLIEDYCRETGISLAGKLMFDPLVVEAMVNAKSITEWAPDSEIASQIKQAFEVIYER